MPRFQFISEFFGIGPLVGLNYNYRSGRLEANITDEVLDAFVKISNLVGVFKGFVHSVIGAVIVISWR